MFCAVVLMLAGTVAFAAEAVKLGDVDSDGKVDLFDATCIQRTLAGLSVSGGISEQAADIDGSGEIEVVDAAFIQRYLVNIQTPYPIDKAIVAPTETVTEPPAEAPTQPSTDADGWGNTIYRP